MIIVRPSATRLVAEAQALLGRRSTTGPVCVHQRAGESIADVDARAAAERVGRLVVETSAPRTAPPIPGVVHNVYPAAYVPVLDPSRAARYRVLYGGRGAGRSWTVARWLLALSLVRPLKVLNAREFMNSLKESVHALYCDQIQRLGLSPYFDIQQTGIYGRNGSEFLFRGLRANISSLKSLEGVDVAWCEEAERISEESWSVLLPTVRAPGSQIIITFNPDAETDPTFRRFVAHPPSDCLSVHTTWRDNPFFPRELELERQHLASVDADAHAWVWEGNTRAMSDAQILKGKTTIATFEPGPDWTVLYGADFGLRDPSVLVRCYVFGDRLFIADEAYGVNVDLDRLPALFGQVPGAREHTCFADNSRPETIEFLRARGFPNMRSCSKWAGSLADGVAHLRQYREIVIAPTCVHAIQEARLYSFKVDRLSGLVLPDIVDAHNHVWDAVRYSLEPLIKQRSPGILGWLAEANQADAARAGALADRPGVVCTELSAMGNH